MHSSTKRFPNGPFMIYQYYQEIKDYNFSEDQILVFGCHELGKHYSGYAQTALHHFGAKLGQGEGRQGQSYGIPTIAKNGEVLDVNLIQNYINKFKQYAKSNPHLEFYLTEIGCGFANFSVNQIGPLFKNSPTNIYFPRSFVPFLEDLTVFSVEDIEHVWKADDTHIELPLNTGTTVRLKLDHHQRLNMQPNVWEKFNTNQNIQYFTLKEHQFNQLDQAIENFRKEEALLFSKLM